MLKKVVLAVGVIAVPSMPNKSNANSNARGYPRKAKLGSLEVATP
jgi:hypothetical protein